MAAGKVSPVEMWPEFFTDNRSPVVPISGADMSEFKWEPATPDSFERDMAAVMAANESVSFREPSPAPAPPVRPLADPPSLEWS